MQYRARDASLRLNLAMAIENDIAGGTPQLRDRKIEQLASVIATMNTGYGPDLLGVCEVENRLVVDRLVDAVNATLPAPRSYAVVHAHTGMPAASMSCSSRTPPCSRFHCLSRSRCSSMW
jgi:hypothetical protein